MPLTRETRQYTRGSSLKPELANALPLYPRDAREGLTHIRLERNKFYISGYSFARYLRMSTRKV